MYSAPSVGEPGSDVPYGVAPPTAAQVPSSRRNFVPSGVPLGLIHAEPFQTGTEPTAMPAICVDRGAFVSSVLTAAIISLVPSPEGASLSTSYVGMPSDVGVPVASIAMTPSFLAR